MILGSDGTPKRRVRDGEPDGRFARNRRVFARRMLRLLGERFRNPYSKSNSTDEEIERAYERHDKERGCPEADVVGATVLLGSALSGSPHVLDRIRRSAPAVVLEVPNDGWIDPMTSAVVACFGSRSGRRSRVHRIHADASADPSERCSAVVVAAGAGGSARYRTEDDLQTASAFRDHRAVIGISTSSRKGLPEDLLRACDETLAVHGFDPDAIALVIEHIVGSRPSKMLPPDVAAAVEAADLRIAVHRIRGADASTERLEALVATRLASAASGRGPRLEDLSGYGSAAGWGLAAAADLAAYGRGELPWSECDPGVLLTGPPGTGKTMFAGALARQAGATFLSGSLAQWQSTEEGHLGTTLKAMRQFFEAAKKAAPCVALVDELDSFGDRRHFAQYHRDYSTQVVNGFLECLDGDGGRAGVLLVGTSNNPDRIDPAILRSGRFDRRIAVALPSRRDLAAILRYHLGDHLQAWDLEEASRRAFGGTGADCAAWVRRARSRARRQGRPVEPGDLVHEIDASLPTTLPDHDGRVAVHESGHAIVAFALGMDVGDIVLRHAGAEGNGFSSCRLAGSMTLDAISDLLAVHLAGRAAEILVFGAPSACAVGDLAAATAICTEVHFRWGLGERISVRDPEGRSGKDLDAVERDLRRAADRAVDVLAGRRGSLDALAQLLVDRRALCAEEIAELLGRRPT
ncbi:AAA family ATPase [Methylobacterium oxalidis]|uniref:AAA family ATPase n=1 Tax=Methylobacterium oxalidis TaxID=944322 RepID=UPI003314ECE6